MRKNSDQEHASPPENVLTKGISSEVEEKELVKIETQDVKSEDYLQPSSALEADDQLILDFPLSEGDVPPHEDSLENV